MGYIYIHMLTYKMVYILCCCLIFLIQAAFQQCPSSGYDMTRNIVQNGKFQQPVITVSPTFYPGGFIPWTTTLAQIGYGNSYNTNWGVTQVAALDTGSNQQYQQIFNLDYEGKFFFSVDFARRQGVSPSTNGLRIYWNGKNVAQEPTANDDLIHSLTAQVNSIKGINTVGIQAMGHDDHEGTTIDNVGIYPFVQYHRKMINGVCSCEVGYFDNGYNYDCVKCSAMIDYCSACSFVPNITLLPQNCTDNITYGADCAFGAFTCTNCQAGYYLNLNGTCSQMQIQSDIYQPSWDLQYISCNKFKAIITIQLPLYSNLQRIGTNNTNVLVTSATISTTQSGQKFKILIQASYIADISQQTIGFTVYYTDTSGITSTAATVVKMKSCSMPLIYYVDKQCASSQQVEDFTIAIVVISYIVLFFSLISFKIVGLELFGVLQLAFLSMASHESVDFYLQPLLKWKYVNGFNVQTTQPITKVSNSVYHMGYKDNFFFNINFMFVLLLVNLIVGSILLCVARRKENKKLYKISMYILKLVFITLFLFNSLNLSFSIGLHFRYADSTTQFYGIGTIGALGGIILFIFAAGYMQCTKQTEFGEYKNKFKKDCVNRFYIPLSIVYRFVLGAYIASQNQWYLGTLIILGLGIAFIMYNVINLPFKKAYQNYRANLCHFVQIIILLVSNFYRSMKANTALNQKARIHWPAILELVTICICVVLSFICLFYEIITQFRRYLQKRKTHQKVEGQSQSKIITHIMNIFSQNPSVQNQKATNQNNQIIAQQQNNGNSLNKTQQNIEFE